MKEIKMLQFPLIKKVKPKALSKAVTAAEILEEKIGIAMLQEALKNPGIPNPEKWAKARGMAQKLRKERTAARRAIVKRHADDGVLTVYQLATLLNVAVTTIRSDLAELGMRLVSEPVAPTSFQVDTKNRRAKLKIMSQLGISCASAARRLDVSEATVRRDLKITGIKWVEEK